MMQGINLKAKIDWVTIFLYATLVILGWINIYAAVYNEEHKSIFDFSQRYGLQLLWIIAAIVIALIVMFIDTKFYTFFAFIIYGVSIILLIMVLIIGKEVHGAKAWLSIGSFSIQPAEFAKVATALAIAKYMSGYNVKISNLNNLAIIATIIVIPMALIALQPDAGSILVFLSFSIVLYREGLPGSILIFGVLLGFLFIFSLVISKIAIIVGLLIVGYILYILISKNYKETALGILIFGAYGVIIYFFMQLIGKKIDYYYVSAITFILSGATYLIISFLKRIRWVKTFVLIIVGAILFTFSVDYVFHHMLGEHQQKRMNILLGIESDPLGMGYNVNQSKIAIGSGGFFGKGFLKGTQTKYNFVPEQSTDFIFCTVGEEWGFVGTFTIVMLFLALIVRVLILAERQRSIFSRIFGYSVASIIFFHFAINIGMTIGILPVIGIPLPFFSYGGSSLWAFTILLFILIRLDASRFELLR